MSSCLTEQDVFGRLLSTFMLEPCQSEILWYIYEISPFFHTVARCSPSTISTRLVWRLMFKYRLQNVCAMYQFGIMTCCKITSLKTSLLLLLLPL